MAEEVKQVRKPHDPNSAKYKLGQIAAKAYTDVIEAKARGEKIGWVSSNFPVEIPETLGIPVCYPENQAAAIAARGGGERLCQEAEGDGYSNDICAYARISLAYAKLGSAPEQDMPLPDFVLCCSNICDCMIKWYENLSRELNIPLIMLDIPFNPDYEVSDAEVALHTREFAAAAKTPAAESAALDGAYGLACTALDFLADDALAAAVTEEFARDGGAIDVEHFFD